MGAHQSRSRAEPDDALSCTIIAKDEGDRIERCILAVRAARRRGRRGRFRIARRYRRKGEGTRRQDLPAGLDGLRRRRSGIAEDCASHDWILNLDADEVVTPRARARDRRSDAARASRCFPPTGSARSRSTRGRRSRGYGPISTTMSASMIAGACVSRKAVCMIPSKPGTIRLASSMASRCTSRGARSSTCATSSSDTPTCRPRSSRSRAPHLCAAAVRVSVPVLSVLRVETKLHGRRIRPAGRARDRQGPLQETAQDPEGTLGLSVSVAYLRSEQCVRVSLGV